MAQLRLVITRTVRLPCPVKMVGMMISDVRGDGAETQQGYRNGEQDPPDPPAAVRCNHRIVPSPNSQRAQDRRAVPPISRRNLDGPEARKMNPSLFQPEIQNVPEPVP